MSKNERNGHRKPRAASKNIRIPELGYYFIFTDAEETEKNYLYGLRDSIPDNLRDKIVIKVNQAATIDLVDYCKEALSLEPQYRIPWIVLDRDQVKNFDNIIERAEREGIHVGWSNPCIEIWFHAHFGDMPTFTTSVKCCEQFGHAFEQRTNQKYIKSDTGIYPKLLKYGNEDLAITLAARKRTEHQANGNVKPSSMCPATTLFTLISEIKGKMQGGDKNE